MQVLFYRDVADFLDLTFERIELVVIELVVILAICTGLSNWFCNIMLGVVIRRTLGVSGTHSRWKRVR